MAMLGSSSSEAVINTLSKIWTNGDKFSEWVENIVGKGEIACYKQFLLFSQCFQKLSIVDAPHQGGSVVSVSDSWPGGCEFDPRLRRLFFMAYFRLAPLQKHVRKVVGGFGKKSCFSTGVRKPGNTYASPTTMIWP